MKKKVWAGIVIILLVLNLLQMVRLRNEMRNIQSNMLNSMAQVQSEVQNIASNVRYELDRENSLISDSSWFYGDMDRDTWEIELLCSVTAKEYNPDITEAVLICGGAEYPMTLRAGQYEAVIPVSVWKDGSVECVQFREEGQVRTETLNWHFSPVFEVIPDPTASFSGVTSYDTKEASVVGHKKGSVDIEIWSYNESKDVDVKGLYLMATVDGKEIQRSDLLAGEVEIAEYTDSGDAARYTYKLDQKYEVPYGSEFKMYVEYVDSYDLHYRILIDSWIAEENGQKESEDARLFSRQIYDADGHILWEPEF